MNTKQTFFFFFFLSALTFACVAAGVFFFFLLCVLVEKAASPAFTHLCCDSFFFFLLTSWVFLQFFFFVPLSFMVKTRLKNHSDFSLHKSEKGASFSCFVGHFSSYSLAQTKGLAVFFFSFLLFSFEILYYHH